MKKVSMQLAFWTFPANFTDCEIGFWGKYALSFNLLKQVNFARPLKQSKPTDTTA